MEQKRVERESTDQRKANVKQRLLHSACKWGGAVLTVLLVLAWISSAWWRCAWVMMPTLGVSIGGGLFEVWWEEPWSVIPEFSYGGFNEGYDQFYWNAWGYRHVRADGTTMSGFFIPLYWIATVIGVATAILWYRGRGAAPGLCVKCGYDLHGADHAVCPECGAAIERAEPAA